MKLLGTTAIVTFSLLVVGGIEAWSFSSKPAATDTTVALSSRRNFFSTSMAGCAVAVAAGVATTITSFPEEADAATNGLALVKPNTLQDKVYVITGATTGIGLESAKALAKGGATVVLTARTTQKGIKAVETVQNYLKDEDVTNNKIYTVQLDLDDLDNVKTFPKRFQSTMGDNIKIDVLLNNAGVMAIPDLQLTKDGYERTFQSNHLGHFALTAKLLPFFQEDGARVINVSSLAYQIAAGKGLDLNNLNGETEYSPWGSYGQSKLENILFTQELQRRADDAGISLVATSLHPGAINTDLARNMMGGEQAWYEKKAKGPTTFVEKALDATIKKALLTPEEGAATQVFLATTTSSSGEEMKGGRFYSDLKVQKLPPFATDKMMAKALWERSEELAGIQFSLKK